MKELFSAPKTFEEFWKSSQASWKAKSIKERNFLKSIGCGIDKDVSIRAYRIIAELTPEQMTLEL